MVNFTQVSANEITRVRTGRSSKYDGLVDVCMNLKPGKAIRIPVEEDEDPDKQRINVANAVSQKVMGAWQAQGLMQVLRIVKGEDNGEFYTAVICKAETEEEQEKRRETNANRAAALAKARAKKKREAKKAAK